MFAQLTRLGAIIAALLFAATLAGGVQAQSKPQKPDSTNGTIRFTEPNGQSDQTAEGDDYFTLNLGDPSDMNNPDDITSPTGWQGVPLPATSGVWTARSVAQDARVLLLHPGFASSAQSLGGHTGLAAPIPSATYNHLIVKYSASSQANARVLWMTPGDPYAVFGAACPIGVPAGDNIIDIDLNGCHDTTHPAWNSRAQWGAIALDPALGVPGVTVSIDWARLVPAGGGPSFAARWQCSNCSGQTFDIYADNDNNPANGGRILLASGLSGGSTASSIPTGKLAPGTYFLAASGRSIPLTYSPGAFTVVGDPVLKFTAPSSSSGADFATDVLGRPWNMNAGSPIGGVLNIRNWIVGNGVGQGSPTTNDPSVLMLNGATNINTALYHYITFDLFIQRPAGATSGDHNEARVLWYNDPQHASATGDILNYYDYWHHYSLDLRTTHLATASGWTGQPSVLRIDPDEEPIPPLFKLGPVTLTADPTVARGQNTHIAWSIVRGGGTLDLFYTLIGGSNGWTRFADNVPVANGGYDWTVNVPAAGNYSVRAQAVNGPSIANWYTNVPLIVTAPIAPSPTPTVGRGCIFSDVCPADYWFDPVQNLIRLGAISGYADNTFRPFNFATRGQLAKIVVVAFGVTINTTGGPHFSDVARDNPFYNFVETAFNKGIIAGYADRTFRIGSNVTRSQLAKIVVVAAGWSINTRNGPHFRDVPASSPFYTFVETAFNHGAISGYADGTFGVGNSATRAQIAKIVDQALP